MLSDNEQGIIGDILSLSRRLVGGLDLLQYLVEVDNLDFFGQTRDRYLFLSFIYGNIYAL